MLRLRTCSVDLDRRVAERADGPVTLTEQEVALLRHLSAHPHRLVPRDELLTVAMGWSSRGPTRAVDAAMSRLRQKVDRGTPPHFVTVRGVGYRFEPIGRAAEGLVGRDDERAAVADLMGRGVAWIALVGGPGVGKTRLAREVLAGRPHLCVALSDVGTRAAAFEALATALGAAAATPDSVSRALAARPERVWLDTIEHLLPALAPDLAAWAAAGVRLLTTSRSPAGSPAETVVRLGPLPPEEAAAWLLSRARLAEPGWTAEPEQLEAIARTLDHNPLALELAAARAPVLTAPELLAALADRLSLLRRPAAADARHVSLRAAIEWSWSLLAPPGRAHLASFSAFAGPFCTADAAEVAGLPAGDAVDVLQGFVESGLARRLPGPGQSRFVIEENVRRFAVEAAPPEAVDRYHRWAVTRGAALAAALPTDLAVLPTLREHAPHLREALHRGGPVRAARAAVVLDALADVGGVVVDRLSILDRALAGAPESEDGPLAGALRLLRAEARRQRAEPLGAREDLEAARALLGDPPALRLVEATLLADQGDLAAADAAARAIDGPDDVRLRAGLLLGRLAVEREDAAAATALFREVRALARTRGAWGIEMVGALRLGLMERGAGRLDAAEVFYAEALALARASGAAEVEAKVEMNRCGLRTLRGDLPGALEHARAALRLHRRTGALHLESAALAAVGALQLALGRADEALPLLLEALELARARRDARDTAVAAGNLGRCRQELGDLPGALAAFEEALGGLPGPQRAWWAVHATVVASGLGRREEARRHLGLVSAALPPDDPWARIARAHLHLADGEVAAAEALCRALAPGAGHGPADSLVFQVLPTELPGAIARLAERVATGRG